MKYTLIILAFLLTGCNPCKYVSKHPECFPSDTIKITKEVIKHVKEYITNDSIIYDSVPCDPITNTVIETKTIYKTNWRIETNTIYQSKEVAKLNPINIELQKDNSILTAKTKSQRKTILSLILVIAGGGLVLFVYAKIKKFV